MTIGWLRLGYLAVRHPAVLASVGVYDEPVTDKGVVLRNSSHITLTDDTFSHMQIQLIDSDDNQILNSTWRYFVASYVNPPTLREPDVTGASYGTEYFVDYVRRQLIHKYGEDFVLRGGLRVQTTLDPKLQTQAYNAVYGSAYGVLWDKKNDPARALVAIDNQAGNTQAFCRQRRRNL